MGSPLVCAATRLLEVQSGQSGQPRPDALSRTAAPVMMIPAFATTPATATRRIEVGVGKVNGAAQRQAPGGRLASEGAGPVASAGAGPEASGLRSAGTDPIVEARCPVCTQRPVTSPTGPRRRRP